MELYALSERIRLGLLCFLLILILGLLAFTAINTVQAERSFQQQYSAAKTGNVSAIRPWMTVHVLSHIYAVPENYLYHSLTLDNTVSLRHVTLYEIAQRKRQPVDQVIHTVQHAILVYRKKPHTSVTPTPTRHNDIKPLSRTPGRKKY